MGLLIKEEKMDLKVDFLHTEDCHTWKDALIYLKETLQNEGIYVVINVITIKTDEEAVNYKFCGSPAILFNGVDVDPSCCDCVEKLSASTCRTYLYKGKVYEYPPCEMIVEALERIKAGKRS